MYNVYKHTTYSIAERQLPIPSCIKQTDKKNDSYNSRYIYHSIIVNNV